MINIRTIPEKKLHPKVDSFKHSQSVRIFENKSHFKSIYRDRALNWKNSYFIDIFKDEVT